MQKPCPWETPPPRLRRGRPGCSLKMVKSREPSEVGYRRSMSRGTGGNLAGDQPTEWLRKTATKGDLYSRLRENLSSPGTPRRDGKGGADGCRRKKGRRTGGKGSLGRGITLPLERKTAPREKLRPTWANPPRENLKESERRPQKGGRLVEEIVRHTSQGGREGSKEVKGPETTHCQKGMSTNLQESGQRRGNCRRRLKGGCVFEV